MRLLWVNSSRKPWCLLFKWRWRLRFVKYFLEQRVQGNGFTLVDDNRWLLRNRDIVRFDFLVGSTHSGTSLEIARTFLVSIVSETKVVRLRELRVTIEILLGFGATYFSSKGLFLKEEERLIEVISRCFLERWVKKLSLFRYDLPQSSQRIRRWSGLLELYGRATIDEESDGSILTIGKLMGGPVEAYWRPRSKVDGIFSNASSSWVGTRWCFCKWRVRLRLCWKLLPQLEQM